ncbi:hypothetical protein LQW54_011683 [Pestalotiopsis sp. IQ-011]
MGLFGTPQHPASPSDAKPESQTVDDDFELLNVFTAFSVNNQIGLSDEVKKQFKEAQDNLSEWQAWEAKTIEDAVAGKVKTGELPQDKSVPSALRRNGYRAVVAKAYREHSAWLIGTSVESSTSNLTGRREQAASVIARSVTTILPLAFQQIKVIVYPLVRSLMDEATNKRVFALTFVRHDYDETARNVRTTIWQLSLDVSVTAGADSKQVEASIKHSLTSSNFSHTQWEKNSNAIQKSVIEAGKEIVPRFTLNLA